MGVVLVCLELFFMLNADHLADVGFACLQFWGNKMTL